MLDAAGLERCALLTVAGVIVFELPPRLVAALAIGYLGFFPRGFLLRLRNLSGGDGSHGVFSGGAEAAHRERRRATSATLKVIAGLELIAAAILSRGSVSWFIWRFSCCLRSPPSRAAKYRRAAGAQAVVARGGLRAFSRRLGLLSAFLFAGILLLTAGMFLVLPRTARAAFERFVPQRYRLTGFSNSVTLGEIGEIKQSSAAVMHVRSYQGEGFLPVKWRGAALAEFDGTRWFNPPEQEQTCASKKTW